VNRMVTSALIAAAALGGCSRQPLSGPPELRLGREECAECGMLVSEDRFSAASLVDRDGERLYLFFDDIGCMLDYERHPPAEVEFFERYVHDHATRNWLAAADASYLLAGPQRLQTPMGSGIAAFADDSAAVRAMSEFGGEVLKLDALAAARRAWMAERYGDEPLPSPTPSPTQGAHP
jgi:nitrous oxide reductase accessory protein NosL